MAGPVRTLAARSRSVVEHFWLPAAGADRAAYAAAVDRAVMAGGYEVVVPAGDAEAFAVSAWRDRISCTVPYASHGVVAAAFDKARLAETALECGLSVPGTDAVGLPAVVKARSHVSGRNESVVVRTESELEGALATADDPLVQEFVEGSLLSLSIVADGSSRVVARVQQRATRVWPEAGVSTRAETEPVDPSLASGVQALVSALGWTGLAQFQFLVPSDGTPRLIDCNGRLYGSLALAVAAGVNLPSLWLSPPLTGYVDARPGCRYQWLEGDLRRAVARRDLIDAARSLAFGVTANHSILSAADPAPGFAHVVHLARRAATKAAG